MCDLRLLYSGGSGGFIVLHFLLLSKKYQIDIVNSSTTIEKIIDQQWCLRNSKRWKMHEVWPTNAQTKLLSEPRLFFFCYPLEDINNYPGKNLVVYTDIDSQVKLSQYKNANWFFSTSFSASIYKLLLTWREHYRRIKDSSWPTCTSWRKVKNLPEHIQQEIINDPNYSYFVEQESILMSQKFKKISATINPTLESIKIKNSTKYQDIEVSTDAYCLLQMADYKIKLQDFINDNGQNLLDQLGLGTVTSEQKELLQKWKNLHPAELLEQIGING